MTCICFQQWFKRQKYKLAHPWWSSGYLGRITWCIPRHSVARFHVRSRVRFIFLLLPRAVRSAREAIPTVPTETRCNLSFIRHIYSSKLGPSKKEGWWEPWSQFKNWTMVSSELPSLFETTHIKCYTKTVVSETQGKTKRGDIPKRSLHVNIHVSLSLYCV